MPTDNVSIAALQDRIYLLIRLYRVRGHRIARVDGVQLALQQPGRNRGARQTCGASRDRESGPFAQDVAHHLRRVRAQRPPHAELVTTDGDSVREDAVDADAGQRERAGREGRGEPRGEAANRPRGLDVGLHRTHVVDRQPRIERRDRRPDVRAERGWIPIGPDDVRHRTSLPDPIRNEYLRREILDEAAQPEMPHDADDGHAAIG